MQYYITNRTALVINPDTQNRITVPSSDPAYPLIVHLIKNSRIDDLHFFTDIGHKLNFNDVVVESTRTRCFNIYANDKIYSTFPSMYSEILQKISNYEIDKILSIDTIVKAIRETGINLNIFKFLKNLITLDSDHLIAHGKFHDYYVNFETNSVRADNKQNVCINMGYDLDYKDPAYSEKELCILGKTLYCINDATLFPGDSVLSKFTKAL